MSTSPARSRGGCCSCSGCLLTVALFGLALVAALGLLYHAATTPYVNLATVATSTATATSAQQKLSLIATAGEQAQSTGKPVPVSVTLSDAEMTSVATAAVTLAEQFGSLPAIDDVVVHAAGARTVQVQAHLHIVFVTLPFYVALHIDSPDQKSIDVTVTDAKLGTVPLPAGLVSGIVDQVRRQVIDRLNVTQTPTYDHAAVIVGVGRVTFNATFEPAAVPA
jgi:hypothetical protein